MFGENVINEIARNLKPKGPKIRIAVLTSGDGGNLSSLITREQLPDCQYKISLVITNNKNSLAPDVALRAKIESYLVDHHAYKTRETFERELFTHLKDRADLVVLAGFLRVLTPFLLSKYPKRIINLHPSLLPKHPGLDAINKARLAKDKESGCTVHLVDEGLDTGPIIAQRVCPILPDDDTLALKKRIQALEHKVLPEVVQAIALKAYNQP